ncbi:MAG: sulfotransferase domain-containing protein [Sporichthyaceae bacterium]
MADVPYRYRSHDEDSARWAGFAFRPGDIVISSRSKHGTTWLQAIVASLIFGGPDLPAPLPTISPWLDFLVEPIDSVLARLERQRHRRFIKTHTPLDGLPREPGVTYLVAARHPLDAAVSLWHQGANLDRARMAALTGNPASPAPREAREKQAWLREWIDADADPRADLDSLPGVLHHLTDAWSRRDEPGVTLVHYADLQADLDGQLGRLAAVLDIDVPAPARPQLVEAAGFENMRARAEQLAPDHNGVLRSRAAFFRRGTSGAAAELLTPAEITRYTSRAAALAPADLLAWLHRG